MCTQSDALVNNGTKGFVFPVTRDSTAILRSRTQPPDPKTTTRRRDTRNAARTRHEHNTTHALYTNCVYSASFIINKYPSTTASRFLSRELSQSQATPPTNQNITRLLYASARHHRSPYMWFASTVIRDCANAPACL